MIVEQHTTSPELNCIWHVSHSCSASVGGNAAVAHVLVEHGADVNRRDSEGKTVMMVRRCLLKVDYCVCYVCQAQGLLMYHHMQFIGCVHNT